MLNLSSYGETICKFSYVNIIFSIFFCFAYKIFAVTILNIIPLTERTFQTQMLTFCEKAVQSPVFYCLLQVYIVHRVSFIVVSVCTIGFAYLLC